jgi:hypothetical protein
MTENDEGALQMLPSTNFGRFKKCDMFGRWFSDRNVHWFHDMRCVRFWGVDLEPERLQSNWVSALKSYETYFEVIIDLEWQAWIGEMIPDYNYTLCFGKI